MEDVADFCKTGAVGTAGTAAAAGTAGFKTPVVTGPAWVSWASSSSDSS